MRLRTDLHSIVRGWEEIDRDGTPQVLLRLKILGGICTPYETFNYPFTLLIK